MLRKYFLAKLFIWLIKRSVSPQFYAIFRKMNFWRNIDRLGLYKNGENLYYLNLFYENIFWQNYLFHSSKEVFLHNFTQFSENWIFEGISTGLTKMVNIWTILNCEKKKIFVKIICSTHQRKCSSTILGNFGKIEFLKEYRQGQTLKNGDNLNYLKLCKEIIFWQNYLFHSSKEVFLHNFTQFLENCIFEGISTGADLTKMVKICIILICSMKIFFGKIIYSTHQKKCFSTILRNFWKIEFLKEYQQARTLQKWWKFELS